MPEDGIGGEELLYRGSVKDVYGRTGEDTLVFRFSDRYSVFDWGEMPDQLEKKGEALAQIGDLCFRFLGKPETWTDWKVSGVSPWLEKRSEESAVLRSLKANGVQHHSLGLTEKNALKVRAFERVKPEFKNNSYDYTAYKARPVNTLVPLEVVFRFGAPEGSSFLARAKQRPGYSRSLGLGDDIKPGTAFPHPIVEFFTKLEPTDRFLFRDEARAVAGLNDEEFAALEQLTLLIALRLRDLFASFGVELWDGKFEFAFVPGDEKVRDLCLGDSIGPDELRLIKDGVHLSKEVLRQEYRDSSWYKALEKAKKLAKERGEEDFRKICREEQGEEPRPLRKEIAMAASALYPALANAIAKAVGEKVPFANAKKLDEVVESLKS